MIDHDAYTTYFETLATKHKDLVHNATSNKTFFRINIEELIAGLPEVKSPLAFILEAATGSIAGADDDTLYDVGDCAFSVIKYVKPDDFEEEESALQLCKKIGFEFISKMRKDAREGGSSNIMRFLETASYGYEKVGPVGDNHFGWRFTFTLKKSAGIVYDASRWNP